MSINVEFTSATDEQLERFKRYMVTLDDLLDAWVQVDDFDTQVVMHALVAKCGQLLSTCPMEARGVFVDHMQQLLLNWAMKER
jgi:hypothetical protein